MAKQDAKKRKGGPTKKPSRAAYNARQQVKGWDGSPRRVGGVWVSGRTGRHGTDG